MQFAILAFAIGLAMVAGFSAHRASICTVRAIAEIMTTRRAYMLASIGKSVLWVWAIAFPFFWLAPQAGTNVSGWQLTPAAVAGGFIFGLGAALNGGCSYSTMARCMDGDGRMLAAILGFAAGVFGFATLVESNWLARPMPAAAVIGIFVPWAALLAVVFVSWAFYEGFRLWQTRDPHVGFADLILAPSYRLSTAALLGGLAGSLLFLIYGPFGYTATFELVIEGAIGTRSGPSQIRWVILVAVLVGMLISTLQRGSFRIDWRPRRAWIRNAAGGVLMGFGVALAPGGNDALVLYGIPTLSPYAIPVYGALIIGIVSGLSAMRYWFGIEMRVACRNDVYVSDNWTRPLPPGGRP